MQTIWIPDLCTGLKKCFLLREVEMGREKSDHYLANDTAAFSQMSPSPLSHYILCKQRDSQQTLQFHLTSCYNICYAYICTYIQTHTYYWDLQHTGVLCIGALALRRDFADCSQVRRDRRAATWTKQNHVRAPLQSVHFFQVHNFHLVTTITSITNNPWCSHYGLLR